MLGLLCWRWRENICLNASLLQHLVSAVLQKKVHVDVGFWAGLVPQNANDSATLTALMEAGALGFKAFLSPAGDQPCKLGLRLVHCSPLVCLIFKQALLQALQSATHRHAPSCVWHAHRWLHNTSMKLLCYNVWHSCECCSAELGLRSLLVHPAGTEFDHVNRQDVENALPVLKRLGAPLYIHAELVDMIAPKVRLASLWADSVMPGGAHTRLPACLSTRVRDAG